MKHALMLMLSAVALVAAAAGRAEACTCVLDGNPPCEAAWNMPLVFAGTVTAIVPVDPAKPAFAPKRVRFAITEAFRGVDTAEVDIFIRGLGGGSCDPDFKEGVDYLVYAHHNGQGPGWTTTICTRTRALNDAGEDLAYLRLPDAQKGTSRIVGTVLHQTFDLSTSAYRGARKPVKGVPVTVTDGSIVIEGATSSDGFYSIAVPPYRGYDVAFGHVDGLAIVGGRRVWIPAYRACAGVDGYARYDGRVSGVLTDARGKPVPFFPLTLASSPRVPLGGFEKETLTDGGGQFEFGGVDPATYSITPSKRLWREDQAMPALTHAPLAVAPAGRSTAGTLVLPDSVSTALIEGLVVDSTGQPAPGVGVTIKRPDKYHALSETLVTDDRGHFRVSVVAGRPYEVEASIMRYEAAGMFRESAAERIDAAGLTPVRLRLARSR